VDDETENGRKDKEIFSTIEMQEMLIADRVANNSRVLSFVSFATKAQIDVYRQSRTYDDFHLTAHYVLIDNIVSWLLGAQKDNIRSCIESTLTCATNKDLRETLLELADKRLASFD
jgi:hypothetical protein